MPIDVLLLDDYARKRRGLIDADRGFGEMPPAGEIDGRSGNIGHNYRAATAEPRGRLHGAADPRRTGSAMGWGGPQSVMIRLGPRYTGQAESSIGG